MRYQTPAGAQGPSIGPCQETSGFLFKHACASPAVYWCDACGKAVCQAHSAQVEWPVLIQAGMAQSGKEAPGRQAMVCTTCTKSMRGRGMLGGWGLYDDPYWYSMYYGGYGSYDSGRWGRRYVTGGNARDPDDFTEADAQSLQAEADSSGGDFELETSGS